MQLLEVQTLAKNDGNKILQSQFTKKLVKPDTIIMLKIFLASLVSLSYFIYEISNNINSSVKTFFTDSQLKAYVV